MGGRQEGSKAAYKKYVRTSPPAPIVYETRFELTGGLRRKSTVYGLNGHRAHCVIFLSVVTPRLLNPALKSTQKSQLILPTNPGLRINWASSGQGDQPLRRINAALNLGVVGKQLPQPSILCLQIAFKLVSQIGSPSGIFPRTVPLGTTDAKRLESSSAWDKSSGDQRLRRTS